VANIFGEYGTQVTLVDDQHAVGQFGSQGADKPLGEAVRAWAPWRNLNYLDAHIGQDSVERRGELAGAVSDEESELGDAVIEVHHEVADLLGGPSAIRVGGRAQQVHGSVRHCGASRRNRSNDVARQLRQTVAALTLGQGGGWVRRAGTP
jgi:hypothetical protein